MPEEPARRPRVVLAFDFGLKRIGVAAGDTVSAHARPVATLEVGGGAPPFERIGKLLEAWQPAIGIVGLPNNVDGSESTLTGMARDFARQLTGRFGLEVALVDERYSSLDAAARLKAQRQSGERRRRTTRAAIDAAAACVILERWFNEKQG